MAIEKRNRIPASELADYTSWNLPPVGNKAAESRADNTLGVDSATQNQEETETTVEDITLEEALTESVMSADALEKIANEAHEEGFNAGREEGINTGYQEGFEKGQAAGVTQGHQEGYEAGLIQAKAEAKELSDQVLNQQVIQLQQLMQRLIEPIVHREEHIESLVINLLQQVTKAVIGHEVKTDHTIIANMVNEAVKSLPVNAQEVTVYLNPDDAKIIQNYVSLKNEWQIGSDPSIEAGGCRVETTQSQIDNTIENRLAQVFEQLLERKNNPAEIEAIDRNAPKSEAGLSAFLNDVQTRDNWDEQQALQHMIHDAGDNDTGDTQAQAPDEIQAQESAVQEHYVETPSAEKGSTQELPPTSLDDDHDI